MIPVDGEPPLTPAQKLSIAFDLFALALKLKRRQLEARGVDDVDGEIARWLQDRPGAACGDGVGRPVTLPRG